MKAKKILLGLLTLLGLGGVFLTGCSCNGKQEDPNYQTIADLTGKRIGYVATSTQYKSMVENRIQNPVLVQGETVPDCGALLKTNKVDAYVCDEPIARFTCIKDPYFKILNDPLSIDNYGFMVNKGYELTPLINNTISKFKTNGTLKALEDKWYTASSTKPVIEKQKATSTNYVIKVSTLPLLEPMSYISNGQYTGFELELLYRIGDEISAKIVVIDGPSDVSALSGMLETGRIDLAYSCLAISEERKQKFDFSDPYFSGNVVLVIRDYSYVDKTPFFKKIADQFVKTFVQENRWLMILEGLGYTLLISIASGILGLALGSGLCAIRRINNKAAKGISGALVHIIQGTPAVVLLMLLFYGFFGQVNIGAVTVAIIGFSIMFGVYSCEIMKSGFDSLDNGQREAALAMGYSKGQTFLKISLPQAAHKFIPVLTGEFISMVKMTSVAGFITVSELTRVGEIIRSQTMEAFFPLIAIALIYFGLCELLTFGLRLLHKKLDPKHHAIKVKGVYVINDGKNNRN